MCKGVALSTQNIEIVDDFLPLDLGSADVILGMKWLESLGGTHVNWKLLAMSFKVRGITVTLQGDPALCTSLVSMKTLRKELRNEGILVELDHIGVMDPPVEPSIPPVLQQTLDKFQGIF